MIHAPETITVDGKEYVQAYPVAKGNCPHCGGSYPAWTPGQIVEKIREHVAATGTVPTRVTWDKPSPYRPNVWMAIRAFGTWSAAIVAAGFAPHRPGGVRYWTRERILDAMRDFYARTGEVPSVKGWEAATPLTPAARTVMSRFGTFNAAMDEAGFHPRGPYGVKLKPRLAKTPEKIGLVSATPVAEVLRDEIALRSLETVAEEIGVDPTYLSKIVRGVLAQIRADYADRILTKLDHPHLLEAARAAA